MQAAGRLHSQDGGPGGQGLLSPCLNLHVHTTPLGLMFSVEKLVPR